MSWPCGGFSYPATDAKVRHFARDAGSLFLILRPRCEEPNGLQQQGCDAKNAHGVAGS